MTRMLVATIAYKVSIKIEEINLVEDASMKVVAMVVDIMVEVVVTATTLVAEEDVTTMVP